MGTIGGAINNIEVDNCKIEGTTQNSNQVGGIAGHIESYLRKSAVKNSYVISQGSRVGGLAGNSDNYQYAEVVNSYVTNTTVKGYSKVGGILGYSLAAKNVSNYVEAYVEAYEHSAGGIVGYLENTSMNDTNTVSKVQSSYVSNSVVKAKQKAGGLIGDSSVPLYESNIENYYRQNLIEAQIICDDETTASLGVGGRKDDNYKMTQTYVYEYSTINGNFVSRQNDTFTTNQYASLDDLKNRSFYTGKLGWGTQFNYNVLSQNKYPILNRSDVPEQTGIDLPTEPGGQSIETNSVLPQMTAYGIGANKLNLDLSSIEEGTSLTYETENTEANTIELSQRTYTFAYNYQVPITLTLANSEKEETIVIEPDEVKNEASSSSGITAYLKDESLVVKGETVEGEFVNIGEGEALGKNSKLYHIEENTWEEETVPELELIEQESKETYEYDGNEIETYGTYSTVNGQAVNAILAVNYNTLTATDGKLEKVQADKIIDSYNEKEYETILGTDGKLYDLKTPITYPENFKNAEIKTLAVNSEQKEAMVYYENGNVEVFNYMTGNVVYEDKQKENISLWEYIGEQWNSKEEITTIQESYEKTKQVEEKLKQKPISENLSQNANYVTMYNSETGEHEIYAEEDILVGEEKSETEKIEEQPEEIRNYYEEAEGEKEEKNNGFYLVIGSIAGVCITLVILRFIIVKRKKKMKIQKN